MKPFLTLGTLADFILKYRDNENHSITIVPNVYKDDIGYRIIFAFDGKYLALFDDGTYWIGYLENE